AAYLDRKADQFRAAVAADPLDLLDRIAARSLGATLWYVPMDRSAADSTSWSVWLQRLLHPWPVVGLFFLVLVSILARLHRMMWIVIAIYLVYLTLYICTSYYARYAFPLLAAKVLLVVWAFDRLLPGPTPLSRSTP